MSLEQLLSEKKPAIIREWFKAILDTYPADTSKFLQKQANQFANPVGHTISEGISAIFDELLSEMNTDRLLPFLDNIIRIRAVQDFTPSQALSFLFILKQVIREELEKEAKEPVSYKELLAIESKIDTLAAISFDIFMRCKEKLYDIKANELKNMTYRLLQRANAAPDAGEYAPLSGGSESENNKEKEVTQ